MNYSNSLQHRLHEQYGQIHFDGNPVKVEVTAGSFVIGCTRVDVKAVETLYIALKALGHIR